MRQLMTNMCNGFRTQLSVFSLKFSLAGKGPFMDGKANIYIFFLGGGGQQWSEGHGLALTGKFFYSHIFRPILHKSAVVLSIDNKLKHLLPIILPCLSCLFPKCVSLKRKAGYAVQSKNNAHAESGIQSCCTARTCKPPQKVKVLYFCGPFVVYPLELWNQRSQKTSLQEARKLPQALRRGMKFFISSNLKEVCDVCRLFVTRSFPSVDTNSLCGSKR